MLEDSPLGQRTGSAKPRSARHLESVCLVIALILILIAASHVYRQATDRFARADAICTVPKGFADTAERHACLSRETAQSPWEAGLTWLVGAGVAVTGAAVLRWRGRNRFGEASP